MVEQRQSALQRIQVGVVGLVVVLLFVSLATMVLERVTDGPTISEAPGGTTVNVDQTTQPRGSDEPLAELGVTPVANEDPSANSVAPADSDNVRQGPAGSRR